VELLERRVMFAAHIVGSSKVYATIQDAVDAATGGATINVDAGVYSELVAVHKTLTIRGPRAGIDGRSNVRSDRSGEAIVNGSLGAVTGLRSTAFFLNANNIVLDGFTVEGQNGTNTYNAGISIGAGKSGVQILNSIVRTTRPASTSSTPAPPTPPSSATISFAKTTSPARTPGARSTATAASPAGCSTTSSSTTTCSSRTTAPIPPSRCSRRSDSRRSRQRRSSATSA
jgi:hypothetical protein